MNTNEKLLHNAPEVTICVSHHDWCCVDFAVEVQITMINWLA